MKIIFTALTALIISGPAAVATAQEFPGGKPVRILIGFAPGGGTDIQIRQVAPKLSDVLGVPVVVENRPGASTMLAGQEVARAAPDGHTLWYSFSGAFAQNPHTLLNMPYDPFKDFTPISLGARGPQVLVVHPSVPAGSLKEFIAWGKANAGKVSYASFGTGTSSHIFGEMLAQQTGIDMVHIPYKGVADAANDLFAGRVHMIFDAATSSVGYVRAGKVKIFGVVAENRMALLPDVPTMNELGTKGIDIIGWLGYFGPAGMRPELVQRLNAALAKALAHPEVRDGFARGIYEAVPSTPAELAGIVKDSYDRWGALIRRAGIKPN